MIPFAMGRGRYLRWSWVMRAFRSEEVEEDSIAMVTCQSLESLMLGHYLVIISHINLSYSTEKKVRSPGVAQLRGKSDDELSGVY